MWRTRVVHGYLFAVRSRSAKDVSLPMYVVFTIGVAMWMAYGLLLGAMPIII